MSAADAEPATSVLPTDRGDDSATFAQKLSVGHQEIGRIVDEVEQIYASQPTEWLALEPIGSMICNQWYEDEDEFEDAVGGSFSEFMHAMPHVEIRKRADGKEDFKILQPDPDTPPCVMTLRVETSKDLWRVLFKSPDCGIMIKHMEFEIGADSKRVIDTLYNHISNAVWNLSSHVRGGASAMPSEHVAKIEETIDQLNALLDVDEPFEVVVNDPTGTSLFKPADGVKVVHLGADVDDDDE